MPLFGSNRDISMFRHISRELISRIISQEVGYYKIAQDETTVNLYGEATVKTYYQPILLNCLISRQDQGRSDVEYGPDTFQPLEFRFLRDDLVDINLFPEVGDIIMYRNNYYEVDNVIENQYVVGKDPSYDISGDTGDHGSSWSMICQTHMTRPTKLNISKERL